MDNSIGGFCERFVDEFLSIDGKKLSYPIGRIDCRRIIFYNCNLAVLEEIRDISKRIFSEKGHNINIHLFPTLNTHERIPLDLLGEGSYPVDIGWFFSVGEVIDSRYQPT